MYGGTGYGGSRYSVIPAEAGIHRTSEPIKSKKAHRTGPMRLSHFESMIRTMIRADEIISPALP